MGYWKIWGVWSTSQKIRLPTLVSTQKILCVIIPDNTTIISVNKKDTFNTPDIIKANIIVNNVSTMAISKSGTLYL